MLHCRSVLRWIGPQASKAVPALIVVLNKLLDSKKEIPDPYPIVDAIGRCSGHLADSAAVVSPLIRLLDLEYRPYTASRACIVEILGRFGRAAAPAIPKLKSLQGDNDLPNYTASPPQNWSPRSKPTQRSTPAVPTPLTSGP